VLRDASLIAEKDLRIELRSRVTTNQVAPLAALLLVLFAFALDPDRGVLTRAAPGLFWIAVLFAGVLAVQRSHVVEVEDRARDGLLLSGLDPAGIFLGKAAAIAAQLLLLEVLLAVGVVVLYDVTLHGTVLLVATCLTATVGIAAAGTIYGALVAGLRARDTLLPLLLMPVLAPVLVGATRAAEVALGTSADSGWPWVQLLAVFAAAYTAFGVIAYGPLLEEGQ
jgi:heme exporter protein B